MIGYCRKGSVTFHWFPPLGVRYASIQWHFFKFLRTLNWQERAFLWRLSWRWTRKIGLSFRGTEGVSWSRRELASCFSTGEGRIGLADLFFEDCAGERGTESAGCFLAEWVGEIVDLLFEDWTEEEVREVAGISEGDWVWHREIELAGLFDQVYSEIERYRISLWRLSWREVGRINLWILSWRERDRIWRWN